MSSGGADRTDTATPQTVIAAGHRVPGDEEPDTPSVEGQGKPEPSSEPAPASGDTPAPASGDTPAPTSTDEPLSGSTDTDENLLTATEVAEGAGSSRAEGPAGEEDAGTAEGDAPPSPDFRTAVVSGVSVDLPNQYPTVVLRETESPRRQLSFSVSLQDGTVLSHAVRRIPTPRPLTHELLSEVIQSFDIDVVAVRIVGRRGAVYFAELDLRGRSGRSVHSCRPSDALAVALLQRVPVPILIDVRLLEETGDVVPGSTT